MAFDIEGARRAGYSDAEIADHLSRERRFDAAGARQAGFSDAEIVSHLTGAPARPARAPMGVMDYLSGAKRAVEGGLTFGLRDELGAAINAGVETAGDALTGRNPEATFGSRYDAALARERTTARDFERAAPITSAVAGGVGGMMVPLPLLAPAAQGAGLAARLLTSAPARGVVAGATGGALTGAGEGEGAEGRLAGALTGAAMGGGLGGALGAGASALRGFSGRIADTLGMRNADTAAERQILRAVERDNAGRVATGQPQLDLATVGRPQAGPGMAPATDGQALVDQLGGRNVTNLAAAAANTPGAAAEMADQLVQARRAARPDRIAEAVDTSLGGGGGTRVADELEALRRQRTQDAAPLYARVWEADPPDTPALRRIMQQDVVQRATVENMRLQQMEAAARGEAFEPNPMRILDAAKRGLDERISATLDPVTGRVIPGRGNESIALRELRDALVRELDTVPTYAAARAAWAGPTQSMGALAQGQQALRANPDILRATVGRMSPSDRDFFRLGVGRAITDMAADPARAATAARRLLEDRTMQARLQAAIPDPAQRAAFMAAMAREVEMSAVERAVSPRAGSQTARLLAGQEDMGVDAPGGMLASLLMGHTRGAITEGLSALYRRTQGINGSTADALSRRLLSADPAANQATVQQLLARRTNDRAATLARAGLAARLLQGSGAGAALATN